MAEKVTKNQIPNSNHANKRHFPFKEKHFFTENSFLFKGKCLMSHEVQFSLREYIFLYKNYF